MLWSQCKLRELPPFFRRENWSSVDLGKLFKIKHLINDGAWIWTRLATSKAHEFSSGLQHFSRTQIQLFFVVQSNIVCLEASEDRLGIQKKWIPNFLIKYLLSNCSLKYEIENGNTDEDEMNSGKARAELGEDD